MDETLDNKSKDVLVAIGENLAAARQTKDWSLEYAGEQLRTKPSFIEAVEGGQLDKVPGIQLYMSIVRSYAKLLNVDVSSNMLALRNLPTMRAYLQSSGIISKNSITESDASKQYYQPTLPRSGEVQRSYSEDTIDGEDHAQIQSIKPNSQTIGVILVVLVLAIITAFTLRSGIFAPVKQSAGELLSGQACADFTLKALKTVEVKVLAESIGETIYDDTLEPNEEFKFSDSRGVSIQLAEPESAELSYDGRVIKWSAIADSKDVGTYRVSCDDPRWR